MLWLSNLCDVFLLPQLCTYLLLPTIPTYLLYHCNLLVPWAVFIPISFLCLFSHEFYTMLWAVLHKYNSNVFTLSYYRTSESHRIVAIYSHASVCAWRLSLEQDLCFKTLQMPFLIIIFQLHLPKIFFFLKLKSW